MRPVPHWGGRTGAPLLLHAVACAAALAGIEFLQTDCIQLQIKEISEAHKDFANRISKHPKVTSTSNLPKKLILLC